MAFDEVRKALDAYTTYLDSIGSMLPRRLEPGLDESEAQRIAHGWDVTLSEDALAVWTWHDGEGLARVCPPMQARYCYNNQAEVGFFFIYQFPSLRAAMQATERVTAYAVSAKAGMSGVPELELVVSYDAENGARYEDLDGTVFARPPRLWDVSFMLDGDRPFYLIDCKDSSAKDSQVLEEEEYTGYRPIGTTAEWIERTLEDLKQRVEDRKLEVDAYGVLRCVPQD